jgi:hypothetical protein
MSSGLLCRFFRQISTRTLDDFRTSGSSSALQLALRKASQHHLSQQKALQTTNMSTGVQESNPTMATSGFIERERNVVDIVVRAV